MESRYDGPGVAPTSPPTSEQPIYLTALAPQYHASFSTASTAVFLSLFGLGVLALAIYWARRRRIELYKRPVEKPAVCDVEALAIAPAVPPLNVRWTPQIRSISGPTSDKKSSSLPPRRARSPPPSNLVKPRNLLPDPQASSAPPYALSFSHPELSPPARGSRGGLTPPVTPQALAVSGMQTRSLGRPGVGLELVV